MVEGAHGSCTLRPRSRPQGWKQLLNVGVQLRHPNSSKGPRVGFRTPIVLVVENMLCRLLACCGVVLEPILNNQPHQKCLLEPCCEQKLAGICPNGQVHTHKIILCTRQHQGCGNCRSSDWSR